jgi:hypothetical protein
VRPPGRALLIIAAVALVVPVLTLRRAPTPYADLQLYASIARSVQVHGVGVPTETWYSPTAVDHVPFYGPVFFDLAALSMHFFGATLLSFRLVSILGTAVFLVATVVLAHTLGGVTAARPLWPLVLVALTPEIAEATPAGNMHILAVGLATLGLAVFVRGLNASTRRLQHGVVAGILLTMAALTTPRTYPVIFGFLCTGVAMPCMTQQERAAARRPWLAAVLTVVAALLVWAMLSHGTPLRWARYISYILLHEDTDVAVLPSAVRNWSFHWNAAITPIAALLGAFAVARALDRASAATSGSRHGPAAFALACTWITGVVTFVGMNVTFTVTEYFALPLFAVVVIAGALWLRGGVLLQATVALLIVCDLGVFAIQGLRTAATWADRDPGLINTFVRRLVPPGSVVVGPEAPYFFPVERSGSRYRTVSARSWADWARWVPTIEPDATTLVQRFAPEPAAQRFLIWPRDVDLPDPYACAAAHRIRAFQPPKNYLAWLGPFGHPNDVGYPATVLYRLTPGCPTGYDPTAPQSSVAVPPSGR